MLPRIPLTRIVLILCIWSGVQAQTTTSSPPDSPKSSSVAIPAGVGGGAGFLVILIAIFLLHRRTRQRRVPCRHGVDAPAPRELAEWLGARSEDKQMGARIDWGAIVTPGVRLSPDTCRHVYTFSGRWSDVILHEFEFDQMPNAKQIAHARRTVAEECRFLAVFFSPHLVRYEGYIRDHRLSFAVVTEPLEHVTPAQCRNDHLRITSHVARGLAYLHEKGVVHMEVRLSNVFFDPKENLYKLSALGKDRVNNVFTLVAPAYSPNPTLETPPTEGMDILCLGVIMLELCTRMTPPPMASLVDSSLRTRATPEQPHLPTLRPLLARLAGMRDATRAPRHVQELVPRCVQLDATRRPSAKTCVAILDGKETAGEEHKRRHKHRHRSRSASARRAEEGRRASGSGSGQAQAGLRSIEPPMYYSYGQQR